jgi:hypothetical protein
MSWSTPSSLTTGTLVTAATWNQDVKDNAIALRGGGIAIASQSAAEVIFASSSTAFSRSAGLTYNDTTDVLSVTNGLGIGVTTVVVPLTIIKSTYDSQIQIADNATDSTIKVGSLSAMQYASVSEAEGYVMIGHASASGYNQVDVGGGFNAQNAATAIRFHAAANTTTRTGTQKMHVDINGVGIGTTSPSNPLSVEATETGDWVCEIKQQETTAGDSYGLSIAGGTNSSDTSFQVQNAAENATYFTVRGDGNVGIGTSSPGATLAVDGNITKTSSTFRIDHPLPSMSNHYLVHSILESPRADLVYRGSVALVAGTATIDIDVAGGMTKGTFEVLCRDEQCFTTNETGWHHVRGSVSGSTLTIECEEECDDVVSWMVVAERQDDHMKSADTTWTDADGRPIIEPEKPSNLEPDPDTPHG